MKKGEFISPFFFVHTKLLEQLLGLCYAIGVLKKNNSPTINTKGLRIEELSKLNSVEFNQKEEDGITSRIKKIK